MSSRNDDNNCTCPNCGTESFRALEAWINRMEDGKPRLCPNCSKAIGDNQSSGCLGSGKKANSNFNIGFFSSWRKIENQDGKIIKLDLHIA